MLVFIDESGDPGFKIGRGASPIFVAVMVIFDKDQHAAVTQDVIERSTARRFHRGEFSFTKCGFRARDLFFQSVQRCPFTVRAIVVRKERIYSPRLKADKDKFYEYFVKSMMQYDNNVLRDARVVIDGSGDREFRRNLHAALRRRLGSGVIKDIRFKHSHQDVLLQLADMCAGAIARSFWTDRKDSERWRKMLAPHIADIWEFK
ncbi:MAG TPA: DUF3800 domain-containing protein [Xanthobacteraceae bacterium]|nr:DUF3800 domain-containing protein [Xanthobacteraceae bacterium]